MRAVLGLGVPQKVFVGPQLFYRSNYISLIPETVDIRCETLAKLFTDTEGYISVNEVNFPVR